MKELTLFLNKKGFLFKQFEKIDIKVLKSRKKIDIYNACDIKNNFVSLFIINQKSRFLIKNAKELELLNTQLKIHLDHNYKNTLIVISSPLCSKAKTYMKDLKWKVYDDFM